MSGVVMPAAMHWPALVTLGAIALMVVTALQVGRARGRFKIAAPATTGHPEFERIYRVQMNTLENVVAFLPALWLFALYVSAPWSAAFGALWLAGRVWYMQAYTRAANKRGGGFTLAFFALMALALGAASGIAHQLVAALGG